MKFNNTEIEQHRVSKIYGQLIKSEGNNGVFRIEHGFGFLHCVVSDGGRDGWEHVSVSYQYKRRDRWISRIPLWDEMCVIKDLFWNEGEIVFQLHPAKENYVNNHPHVLHLWRPVDGLIPLPPNEAVGIPGLELDPNNPAHARFAKKFFLEASRSGVISGTGNVVPVV